MQKSQTNFHKESYVCKWLIIQAKYVSDMRISLQWLQNFLFSETMLSSGDLLSLQNDSASLPEYMASHSKKKSLDKNNIHSIALLDLSNKKYSNWCFTEKYRDDIQNINLLLLLFSRLWFAYTWNLSANSDSLWHIFRLLKQCRWDLCCSEVMCSIIGCLLPSISWL
jgi:hypothetical protein